MGRLPHTAARFLFAAILFVGIGCWVLGVGVQAFGIETPAADGRILTISTPQHPNTSTPDFHVVRPPAWMDLNGNHVEDRLERVYRRERRAGLQPRGGAAVADLMLCLDHSPDDADVAWCRAMGATEVEAWGDLAYVVRARFPAALLSPEALAQLGRAPGVVWVEENAVLREQGFFAGRQTRARAAGLEGSPDQSIAILDGGVDATHPDLGSRTIAWMDFAGADLQIQGDEYPTPTNKNGHGTAVAGLAAGDGSAGGIAEGVGALKLSQPLPLFTTQTGRGFPVDTTAATSDSTLTARLKWSGAFPNVTHTVELFRDAAGGGFLLGNGSTAASGPQPFELTVGNIPAGVRSFFFYAWAGTSSDFPAAPYPAWLQVSTPMSAAGDGRPLMRGVAPGCKIVAVKVTDDTGSTTTGTMINGISWLNANRRALNLVCVNASVGGPASALLDTMANQIVRNGVVWVGPSGNDGESPVDSPGAAAKAISVGATSELDQVTNYSNIGRSGQRKPDLVAPGGSFHTGRLLIGVDTNSADSDGLASGGFVADQFPNDYRVIGGATSFASAQVAGAAMLVAQGMGAWSATETQALRVKMILLMTASETGVQGEGPPDPDLNRGIRDRVEGFGRLNVDAAVEAVTQSLTPGTPVSGALGPGVWDKKVWARGVTLIGGTGYSFALSIPADADYDLYLYSDQPSSFTDSDGEPTIAAKSTRAGLGGSEAISRFVPPATGRYYLVVKYVTGGGGTFQVSSTTAGDFALSVSPGAQRLEAKGDGVRYTVSATSLGGFGDAVSLSVAGLPAGVTAQFNPTTITPGQTSTLTLTTSAATPTGSLAFTVQGAASTGAKIVGARLETGAVWPRFHHDGRGSGRSAIKGPQAARLAWVLPIGAAVVSSPAIGGDGTVYVGSRAGSQSAALLAVNPGDGTLRWSFPVSRAADIDSSPALGIDDTIYFGDTGGNLYALRPDGSPRWQFKLGTAPVTTGPVIGADGTIYVTAGGALHAVHPDGTRKWTFDSRGTVSSSPSLGSDGTLYFGGSGHLYAVRDNDTTAAKKWEFATAGDVLSSPAVAQSGRIYFGASGDSTGGRLYVITDDGTVAKKLAETTTAGAVRSSPALGPDGTVYLGDGGNALSAFTADGVLKWSAATQGQVVASPVVGGDGTIYVGSRDGTAYAFRDQGSSAQKVWSAPGGAEFQASGAIGANGTLYLPTLKGALMAFQDTASPAFSATIAADQSGAVLVGGVKSYTVQVSGLNGFDGSVKFEVAAKLPAGITATFEPATVSLANTSTAQTTLRLATSGAAPAGELLFRVRATSGTLTRETERASLQLMDYALAAQPDTQRVTAGQATIFSVALTPNPTSVAINTTIGLTASVLSGPPAGTAPTLTLDQTSIPLPGLVSLTVATRPDTPPGAYLLEARGAAGAITRTAAFRLEVAGFNLATTPASQSVTRGGTTTYTINVERLFGFSDSVALAPSGTLPAGVSLTFTPADLSGATTATLGVTTTAATPTGTHTLTFMGAARGITRTGSVTLTVTAP